MANIVEVFVIDDNDIDCLIARVIIERNTQFKSTLFGSTRNAIDYLDFCVSSNRREALPGIILLDLDMPLEDGWEFLDQYESLTKEIADHVPDIYILSSSINPLDHQRAQAHHLVKEMLTKPLTPQQVNKILATHLADAAG